MVIVHVAGIDEYLYRGTSVAVPQHVITQSQFANVCFININNIKIKVIENQFDYCSGTLKNLPSPYSTPDLVVFHEVYKLEYIKLWNYLRRNNIAYIIIPHGELSNEAQKHGALKKKIANVLLFNRFINNAIAIQYLSEREKNCSKFGKMKIIGTNGVSITDQLQKQFHSEKMVFSFIGRLDIYYKGLDLLLNAISDIKQYLIDNNCEFHIYGPDILGRLEALNELVSQNNVEDIVHIHKEVSGEEKIDVLNNTDIFIQTSRSEGMPMGIIEALGYGVPCLVTFGTTLGEMIQDEECGWACEADVSSIAKAIKIAVSDKITLNIKSNNAKMIIKRRFTWENVSRDTVEKYKKIVFQERKN